MEKLPFFQDGMPDGMNVDDRELVKVEAMIQSMTAKERLDASLFDRQPTRIDRVAKGSGRAAKEVKELVQKFKMMRDMMGNIGQQAGLLSKIPGMKQLAMAKKLKSTLGEGGGIPGMPQIPGMPGLPGGLGEEMLQAAVADQAVSGGGRRGRSVSQKKKQKTKRKQAKKSRKKSRK
jgi:signal recognition particle subunit SRP54